MYMSVHPVALACQLLEGRDRVFGMVCAAPTTRSIRGRSRVRRSWPMSSTALRSWCCTSRPFPLLVLWFAFALWSRRPVFPFLGLRFWPVLLLLWTLLPLSSRRTALWPASSIFLLFLLLLLWSWWARTAGLSNKAVWFGRLRSYLFSFSSTSLRIKRTAFHIGVTDDIGCS